MATWILSIDKDHPQHWAYAVRHGLWDLRTPRSIKAGDIVHFWQGGPKGGWVGRVRAVEDAYAIDEASVEPGPWDDWGTGGQKPYRARFALQVIDATAASNPRWTQVQTDLGVAINPGWNYSFSPHQEEVLASYFDAAELTPEQSLDDAKRAQVFADLSEGLRVRTLQVIALRQGQSAFRKSLLAAYSGACAVTGTATERVLEAAHIAPYKGEHTNQTDNGLLLRADIHTLFDLYLITITPDHIVRVSAEVEDAEYSQYDGRGLAHLPRTLTDLPDAGQLTAHNAKCAWLRS